MCRFHSAALALMLIPGAFLAAGTHTLWDFAPYSHLKRIPAEPGAAANSQPLKVDPAVLARTLGAVRFMGKTKEEPLFIPVEATAIADAMAEALALAQPGEDLELLSTMARGGGVFMATRSVTARAFVRDGKLNLIVRDPRLDIYFPAFSNNQMAGIDCGSRVKAGAVVLKAQGAEAPRADWLVLPLGAEVPATPAAVPAPAQPQPPSARTASVEDHLRDLKRFRDQGLITEEEYAKGKQDLLKTFSSDVACTVK